MNNAIAIPLNCGTFVGGGYSLAEIDLSGFTDYN
jgi:hypothetical protein